MTDAVRGTNLSFDYGDGESILADVSVCVPSGGSLAIVGSSGCGKSTLLYLLSGLLRPTTGSVSLFGEPLPPGPNERADVRLRRCGFVFQNGELLPELTLLENVALPLRLAGEQAVVANDKACEALDRFGILELSGRRPEHVSGGQAQRAAIARALVHDPQIVFADEPTASLGRDHRSVVVSALANLSSRGCALLVATHDAELAAECESRLALPSRYD
jgi:putative ABC transport system ATP-binding protein